MKKPFLLLVLLLAAIPTFGQTAQLSPTIIAFGNTGIGTTSPAQTLTVTNSGGSNLILTSSPLLGGANASDFTISPSSTCTNGTSIAPTFSCTVVMTFTPGAAGARSGTVSIFSNDPSSPSVANLSGVGLSGGSNSITVNCPAASNCKVVGQITMTVGGSGSTTPPAIVTVSPSTGSVQINGTFPLVATVMNDPSNLGVKWSVSGANCSSSACGSISPTSSLSGATVTYTAPPAAPVGAIFITATAVANNASFQSNVTVITPNPPPSGPAGVNVFTPSCAHASTTTTCAFTGYSGPTMIVNLTPVTTASTVTGVQGCISGSACQSLTLVGSVSGVYQFRGINIGAGFNQVVVSASDTNQVNVAISDTANVGAFDTFTTKTAGATTNPTGPSITTATANELVVCALDSSGTVTAAASPFVFNQVGNKDGYAATINPTASAISPSWTTTSGTYAALCGAYSVGTTPAAITVTNNPVSVNVQSSATQQFTAIVGNDPTNNGVNWTCASGGGSCGSFSPTHTSSGQATTWTAPALVPPGAAVTLLQHVKLLDQAAPFTIPITSSSAGSTLCVFDVWNATGGTMSVTDSKGETWPAPIASRSRTSRGMSYACLPNNVGGVTSITVSVSGAAPTSHEMYAREYSGMLTSSIVDQHAETGTSSSPMDSGFMSATTNANDVLIGFGENGAASSFTAGNDGQGDNYGNLDQQTFLGSAVEDFFPTTATNTYKATMTPNVASSANMMVVALKAGTGSGTGNANITVTSTSVADGTKICNSTVTLTASTPPISVVVNPTSGTLTAGTGTISITPTVTNDSGSGNVNWTLTGLGSISLNSSASGTPTVYTPPASVSTAQSVTITATSVTDNTKSASATILVNPTTGGGGGTGGLIACTDASCPAFQGALGNAQGGGAASLGGSGRNGTGPPQVFLVTNLNDSGTGSLRACAQAVGARFCIFRVSGLFTQQSQIRVTNPYLYVAGQTAPGGGEVQGGVGSLGQAFFIATHDVVVRYMTFDGASFGVSGSACNHDNGTVGIEIGSANTFNIVIDHNSHRWWQNKDFEIISNGPGQNAHDLTMQWNMGYEPCIDHPVLTEPDVFAGGSQFASTNQDWHHNFFANSNHRHPLLAIRSLRWVNNIVYNALNESDDFNWSSWGAVQADIIGSKWVDGPNSNFHVFNIVDQPDPTAVDLADCNPTCDNGPAQGRWPGYYVINNQGHAGTNTGSTPIPFTHVANDSGQLSMMAAVTNAEGAKNPTAWPTTCGTPGTVNCWLRTTPLSAETFPITADPGENLDTVLLSTVGNSGHLDCQGNLVNNRDSQDARIIAQYQAKGPGGAWNPGVSPYNGPALGHSPAIPPGTLCPMTQNDGIYDGWKQKYGFSTTDPNLWKQKGKSGYLRIEEFLNGIIPQ